MAKNKMLDKAITLASKGKQRQALDILLKEINKGNLDQSVLEWASQLLLQQNRHREAVKTCELAFQHGMWDYFFFATISVSLLFMGEGNRAKEYALRAVNEFGSPQSKDLYAYILMRLGEFNECVEILEEIMILDSFNRDKYIIKLADAYRLMGNYDKAIDLLQEAVEDYPYRTDAYFFMGQFLSESGLLEEATTYFDKALNICSDPQELLKFDIPIDHAYYLFGLAQFSKKRYKSALESFRNVISHNPQVEAYWLMLASTLVYLGEFKDAMRILNQLVINNENIRQNPTFLTLLTIIEGDEEQRF